MAGPADTKVVWLHIGLHKTGSSYLQSVLRANRDHLADQGVHIPARVGRTGPNAPAWDLMGRRPSGSRDDRVAGQWDALADDVRANPLPTTLVSMEYLSLATVRQARRAVQSFGDAEVRVVVTARDLGRVLVSAWQEEVKNDQAWTWEQFAAAVRDPQARTQNPARGFWLRQDLPAILETWRAVLPVERVHVVTNPPTGAPPHVLLERLGEAVGFDPQRLPEEARWVNESLGVAGTEVVRRLNERLGHGLNQRQYERVVRNTLVPEYAERAQPMRFGLPGDALPWVRDEAQRIVDDLAAHGHPVVGDLGDLTPTASEARHPDSATDAELLDAALHALAGLSTRYATAWWARREPDRRVPAASSSVRAVSGARGAAFRGKRAAVVLADRNRVAGAALRAYLAVRAAARRRAARR